jgi:hypothetical protein
MMHGSTDQLEQERVPATSAPLTSTEALLWTIERDPALRSTIVGVAVLDGHADVEQLYARIRQVTQVFPRLRQRVTRSNRGELRWTEAVDWDLEQHLTPSACPHPGRCASCSILPASKQARRSTRRDRSGT